MQSPRFSASLTSLTSLTLLASVGFGALLVAAPRADACDEIVVLSRLVRRDVRPNDGATDVPTNVIVFIGGAHTFAAQDAPGAARDTALPIVLEDAATATAIPGVQSLLESSSGALSVFTPGALLSSSTTYRVLVDGDELARFTTGADSDDDAPPVPAATFVDAQGSVYAAASCDGQPAGARFTVDSPDAAFVLAHVSGDVLPALPPLNGQLDELLDATGGPHFITQRIEAAQMRVRFAAVDDAGQVSAWSDPITVEVPGGGCTCHSTSGGAASGIAAAACALVLLRPWRSRRRVR
jgi:hypothetical protein